MPAYGDFSQKRVVVCVVACALGVGGCAGHATTMQGVRDALAQNDVEEARARLAEAGKGTDDLLFALEDGLLVHYLGDYELSNLRLEFAEQRIDELYTKSLTRAAFSLLTSDLVLRFEPRGIDVFLINYYRALNYYYLGEQEEALVEWRKLASKLQFSRDNGEELYYDPPFFDYLVGLGLEADDPANAYVSLRLAEAGYRERGRPPPPGLIDNLMRLAAYFGFTDHLLEYERRYGSIGTADRVAGRDGAAVDPGSPRGSSSSALEHGAVGELVLFVEEGFVAPILEINAYIPILKKREKQAASEDEERKFDLAMTLADAYAAGDYEHVTLAYEHAELAYILPLAFPAPGFGSPAFDHLEFYVNSDTVSAEPALLVSQLQMEAFEDRLLGIYAKTIVRALLKYAAAEELEKKAEEETGNTGGDVMGFLTNAVNVLTERADTRAWLGLPHRIWVARLRLPPGVHDVTMQFGESALVDLGVVEVRSGQRTFLGHRVF